MRSAILVVLAFTIASCAHTSISSRQDDACGEFESSDTGLGLVVPPGDQYTKYSSACAMRRTVEVIAAQREAVIRASWAAVAATHPQSALRANTPERIGDDLAQAIVQLDIRVGVRPVKCIEPAPRAQCQVIAQRLLAAFSRSVTTTRAYLDASAVLVVTVGPSGNTVAPYVVTGEVLDVRSGIDNGTILATTTRHCAP